MVQLTNVNVSYLFNDGWRFFALEQVPTDHFETVVAIPTCHTYSVSEPADRLPLFRTVQRDAPLRMEGVREKLESEPESREPKFIRHIGQLLAGKVRGTIEASASSSRRVASRCIAGVT